MEKGKSGMVSKKEWFRDFRKQSANIILGKEGYSSFLVCLHSQGWEDASYS